MAIENEIKEEEMKIIEKLRQRFNKEDMESEMYEDAFFFRRFLAAREYDLDKTEKMIRKHLEWREKNDVINILTKFKALEVVEKYGPFSTICFDKEGNAVLFSPVGNIDITGVMSSCKFEDLARNAVYEIERHIKEFGLRGKESKKNAGKFLGIVDIGNLTFNHATDKRAIYLFLYLMRLCMNNYPGRLKGVYFINASFYFSFVHSLMKSVLPTAVMEKIQVHSDESYKEALLEVIDADVLPAFLGGNKTDPDGNPLCLTFGIRHTADPVPDSYYIQKNRRPLSKQPEVKKATLPRAEFHEIKLDVKELGSYLEWEFETKCRDVGFGLFYEELIDGEEKIMEIVPIQRIDTEEYPETGTIKCEKVGTYIIVFDNTYSWIRGKEIYYRTKIINPKEHESQLNQ